MLRLDRIKEQRAKLDISQDDLAQRCEMSASQIYRIEVGDSIPTLQTARLIAETLRVSLDYLAGLTDEPQGHITEDYLTPREKALVMAYRSRDVARLLQSAIYLIEGK